MHRDQHLDEAKRLERQARAALLRSEQWIGLLDQAWAHLRAAK